MQVSLQGSFPPLKHEWDASHDIKNYFDTNVLLNVSVYYLMPSFASWEPIAASLTDYLISFGVFAPAMISKYFDASIRLRYPQDWSVHLQY